VRHEERSATGWVSGRGGVCARAAIVAVVDGRAPHRRDAAWRKQSLRLTGYVASHCRDGGVFELGDDSKTKAWPKGRSHGPRGIARQHFASTGPTRESSLQNVGVMVTDMTHATSPSLREQAATDREHIDALADDIALCAARLHCVEHELLTNIRQFDELKGWSKQGSRSASEWLTWRIGIGRVAAREKVRVAVALGSLPKIDAALARGELSYCKVRALTRIADVGTEDLLLAQAHGTTGAELERICSGFRKVMGGPPTDEEHRTVRRRFIQDGTVQIEMRLLPDEAERVWQALTEQRRALALPPIPADGTDTDAEFATEHEHETATICSEGASAEAPTMADAAVAIAERVLADAGTRDTSGADRRLLFVHLSERFLPGSADQADDTSRIPAHEPWKAELQDGTAILGESLLRLACDSGLLVAKTDAKGHVLDLGRRRRTVSPALMRALRLRDRGCRFPGCNQRAFVDAHHIEHWAHGGATCLDNVMLVCGRHHLAVHEGGFRVTQGEDGELVFFDPDGALIPPIAPLPPSPSPAEVIRRLAARGQRVHAHTTQPHGRGWSVDLHGCVSALYRRREAMEH